MRVHGFVSSPSAGRGSRGAQYFFCNGRFIKSALLQAAVEQAYKNTLLTGRYPACVIYLELGCGSVDVNVHPAKTEVKFSYEKKVFDLVYHAALYALSGESRTGVTVTGKPVERPAVRADITEKPAADTGFTAKPAVPPLSRAAVQEERPAAPVRHDDAPAHRAPSGGGLSGFMSQDVPYQTRIDLAPPRFSTANDTKSVDTTVSGAHFKPTAC